MTKQYSQRRFDTINQALERLAIKKDSVVHLTADGEQLIYTGSDNKYHTEPVYQS